MASEYVPLAHATAYLAPLLASLDTPLPPLIQTELSSDVQEPAVTAVQTTAVAALLYVPIGHGALLFAPIPDAPDTPLLVLIQALPSIDAQYPAVTSSQPAGVALVLYVPEAHAIRISPPLLTQALPSAEAQYPAPTSTEPLAPVASSALQRSVFK